MTTDSDDGKRLREANQHRGNDRKRVIERIAYDGDSKDSRRWPAAQSHQPPKGSVIRWEKFLHVRSIKVLLVENDDSTRHVVTALLRNSNYEVIQAANGLQAWKILEDLNTHIDLVLTEVVMPGLSGIGLLCKIMSHNLRKNIPLIMMSSHDSMALVFNCLSKGAVDFLVKPIRKNELKNLWQHIWRRCHSSSGSGAKTQKSVNSKSSLRSEEGSSSSEAYNNRSASLKVGNESEEGSGTQTSWTKQAIEVNSSPAVCSGDQTAVCADNTCTLVIHPNNKVQLDHAAKGKVVTRKRRNFESKSNGPVHGRVKLMGREQNPLLELEFTTNSKRLDKKPAHPSVEYPSNEYKAVITNIIDPQMSSKTMRDDDSKELVGIELSLKKLREVEDADKKFQRDRNVLRCSELSAFSRYNTPSSATNLPNMITGNSSQPANTIVKKEYVCDIRPNNWNTNILHPSSNGISKNTDMGSITQKISTDPLVFESEPMRNDFSGSHQDLPIQHIHHHHHVHHYHDNDFSLKKLAVDSPLCGSSNVLGGPVEGQPEDRILNRSGSGSKHGSNNQNGSSTAANAGGTNVESHVGLAVKDGGGDDASGRETVLTKFCQKRKEPCFQKKVRYQNKQRLAEERSRVQFVRQKGHQSSNNAMDE